MPQNIVRCFSVLLVIALLAACTPAVVAPEPTAVPPTATSEPTATSVPPTATPEPTATTTPIPNPALKNLLFGAQADLGDGRSAPATFPVGTTMLYASVDAVALPNDTRVEWTLTRGGYKLFDEKVRVISGTSTLTYTLFENARNILPGDYRLVVLAANRMQDGHFVVSADQAPPGTTLLSDNFDDNTLGWNLSHDPRQASSLVDGQLRLEAKAPDAYASVSASPLDLSDFDYSVTIEPAEGSAAGWATLWFRYSAKGGYALTLDSTGAFQVSSGSYSAFETLLAYQHHAALKRNGLNTVRIVGQGDKFAVYLNDELAGTFSDKRFSSGDFVLSVGSGKKGGVAYLFDNVLLTTPRDQVTMLPTPTKGPAATPKPIGTAAPKATSVPKASPLKDVLVRARTATENIGGAMDRLYHGSGVEACGPLVADYLYVSGAPEYDLSAQPANIQNAYGPYRQAVGIISAKIAPIYRVCTGGGGTIGKLDFDVARRAINEAGSLFTQALNLLGQ